MTAAACKKPFGAITSRRTAMRLATATGSRLRISTPARPGKCPVLRRLNCSAVNSGRKEDVLIVMSAQGKLAVEGALCQARGLLDARRHVSVFTRSGFTGDKKGR